MELGARLRSLRLGRTPPLTLADVAGEQLSVALVSKIERGLVKPSLTTLEHLAVRLGVSVGALFDEVAPAVEGRAVAAHDAARARLLLGDPAGAAAEATAAATLLPPSHPPGLPTGEVIRSRLLGVAAEASLTAGQTGAASRHVMEASQAVAGAGESSGVRLAQAELAWVLGLMERRRGALEEAQRTHTGALGVLEAGVPAHPWWQYLRAGVLAELSGLAEARGDLRLARDHVSRAASIAAGIAQAAVPAQALLGEWAALVGTPDAALDAAPAWSAGATAAFALAVTAAADRLVRRLTQEAARLERAATTPGSAGRLPAFPDASHSRHLA